MRQYHQAIPFDEPTHPYWKLGKGIRFRRLTHEEKEEIRFIHRLLTNQETTNPNKYIASLFKISRDTVSRVLSEV